MSDLDNIRVGSKRWYIIGCANRDLSRAAAFAELRPMVDGQIEPMIYKTNPGGGARRQPKPMADQLVMLRHDINRNYAILEIGGSQLDVTKVDDEEDVPDDDEPIEEEPKPIRATGKVKIEDTLRNFRDEVRRIRKWCVDRARTGEEVDEISLTPIIAGSKLIPQHVPMELLLHVMCLSWPDGARADANIPSFDMESYSLSIMEDRGIPTGKHHKMFGWALMLAENRIPIFLVGPTQSGKSHIAKDLAAMIFPNQDEMYGESPMSSGAMRGDLTGKYTIKDFIPAQFSTIYQNGGVFNFEELDAGVPEVLVALNNALAQNDFYNPTTGQREHKSSDFIPCATGNTWGLGATRRYVSRERIDAASLERWRMGRMYVDYDENIEDAILGLTK